MGDDCASILFFFSKDSTQSCIRTCSGWDGGTSHHEVVASRHRLLCTYAKMQGCCHPQGNLLPIMDGQSGIHHAPLTASVDSPSLQDPSASGQRPEAYMRYRLGPTGLLSREAVLNGLLAMALQLGTLYLKLSLKQKKIRLNGLPGRKKAMNDNLDTSGELLTDRFLIRLFFLLQSRWQRF